MYGESEKKSQEKCKKYSEVNENEISTEQNVCHVVKTVRGG